MTYLRLEKNISMKWFLFLLSFFMFQTSFCQYKSFTVLENGDTLNRVDADGKKQARWKIHVNALRTEPAYDEEGAFKNDLKEGVWRRYDMYGLLTGKENYKWGMKNGLQQYLSDGRLEREENWLAIDPAKKYDTIEVQDVYDDNKYIQRIFKVEAYAVEHGTWRYFDPETGSTIKTENYVLGEIRTPQVAQISIASDTATKKIPKPAAVLEYEKSNKNKKSIKIRQGQTGG